MVSLVWCNSTQEKEEQLPRQKSYRVTELNHCLTYWSRSTTPNNPFLRVILMGFLWPPQVTCPSFFFIKADVCHLLQCWKRNPGLWVYQVGTLPLGCIHPQLLSYLCCEHQKWLNTCDQCSKGGEEWWGWLGLEVNNSIKSLSFHVAFPIGPRESSHFSLTPRSQPHQRAYVGGSVSWLRWSGGA